MAVTNIVFLILVAGLICATTMALDQHTLFFQVRTDLTNDEGNLSFYSVNLLSPSDTPALVGGLENVPAGHAEFGVDPVRNFLYFDQYQVFDKSHEGLFFGRFNLDTPNKIEHLDERTDQEPGGLRVAPGSRIGETFFASCLDKPSTENHAGLAIHVFDNGDLDVRTVTTFTSDELDNKACIIPVAYSYQEPSTLFVAGANAKGGVVYVIPVTSPTKKYPIALDHPVVAMAYMNNTVFVLVCNTNLQLYSFAPSPSATPTLVTAIASACDSSYRWQMSADPLINSLFLVAGNQTTVLSVDVPTRHVQSVLSLAPNTGRLQGVHVPWWDE